LATIFRRTSNVVLRNHGLETPVQSNATPRINVNAVEPNPFRKTDKDVTAFL
jgi:hypothetical protein